ncbi:hypothetical protein GUITHDRAFT_89817 [Guillardia theta CCMP2712]|uniref:Carrier domain-containing protein n=1 Tax=Guillardia theta (strain CCMP2712) TaxID=905079 RepID=L1ILJ8_GUITC|nr:hypothetical protein GUITHDRAFT_89817 [Guillardia theta CCMP2712]EKX36997.1 hypothetical protein GUITHDRAFT_89817 [Guillardia theta CCMP2712]|eukprot:XP_005823977.1 hypothetical protein GUITHDRAFT_89817 [Guillardia theta CCMP2712]
MPPPSISPSASSNSLSHSSSSNSFEMPSSAPATSKSDLPDVYREYEGLLLHDLFRKQARLTPDRVAIVDQDRRISYRDLDVLTDRLALWLIQRGAGPDKVVAIYMKKQLEYSISYIAILKAGAAYLPMDVAYPPDLVQMVVTDASPAAILTTPEYFSGQTFFTQVETFVFDQGWEGKVPPHSLPQIPGKLTWDNLAYVVYSSGTTGKPKGICCPHRGAVLSYAWRFQEYPYSSSPIEREACNVFFVWEMLRPLLRGQELHIVPDTTIYDVEKLPQFISKNAITRMLFTPSLLEAMLSASDVDLQLFKSLKLIILCGEVVTMSLRNKIRESIPGSSSRAPRIHNLYSISEAHDVAGSDLTDDAHIDLKRNFCPVGKLLPAVGVKILDESMNEVPPGVHGEIYITGPMLAREYLQRPDITAERFPMRGGQRVYRSGDVGYLVGRGLLEICGRCDSMVKVRGYSIELKAVQRAILELKQLVHDCVVIADGLPSDTDKTLLAFLVPADLSALRNEDNFLANMKKQIRTLLKRRLPFYMIPTHMEFLDSIPAERKVANIFKRVLGLKSDAIDTAEGFFDLGGNSLLTIPLLKDLSASFGGRKVLLEHIFAYPNITQLASFLEKPPEVEGEVRDLVQRNLDNEVELYAHSQVISINTRAFWRHVEVERLFKTRRVMLTGVTGFLGAFLAYELLRRTKAYVYCLVRAGEAGGTGAAPADACRSRVLKGLESYGLLTDEVRADVHHRLDAIVGDASLECLGLEEEDYTFLTQHIDVVIHAAAQVNLVYPYEALVPANVRGTSSIVSFCLSGKVKALHYVSTDAVFPSEGGSGRRTWSETTSLKSTWKELKTGYSQSKWVAEQLVLQAHENGLPGAIYRCGNISGHSESAAWNPKDSNLSIMQACVYAQAVPIVQGLELCFEMTPVDFVSRFVVSCVEDIRNCTNKVFHLIQPSPLSFQNFMTAAHRAGYTSLKAVHDVDEWVKLVELACSRSGHNPVTRETLLDLCWQHNQYDTDNVSSWLARIDANEESRSELALSQQYPQLTTELMAAYLSKLKLKWKLLPHVTPVGIVSPRALESKVVVVTGASGGIGQQICKTLSLHGAYIALVARRKERLVELEEEINSAGGRASSFQIDVTDAESVTAGVAAIAREFSSPIWGLVNSASMMQYQHLSCVDLTSWSAQVDLNCKGVLNMTGAIIPSLIAEGRGGHIINISSDAGRASFPGLAVYSATKHFVEAWARGLRQELALYGIRVTNIQPGDVKSELMMRDEQQACSLFGENSTKSQLDVSDVAEAVLYAMTRKASVAVNEILVEPTSSPLPG